MMSRRKDLRVTVLSEDARTEGFIRALLISLGFHARRMTFDTAPSGQGAAEAWVLRRYLGEVRELRRRGYQKALRLIAVRDGDRFGLAARKLQMEQELKTAGLVPRGPDDAIAVLIPTWSIETWLLALLGETGVHESTSLKTAFEGRKTREREDVRAAAEAWRSGAGSQLPSLVDGRVELERIDP